MLKLYCFFVLVLWSTAAAFAQQGRAGAKLDTANILIGDHVHLELSYTFPEKGIVRWPAFSDTLTGKIEILEKSKTDTIPVPSEKMLTLRQVLTLTCFDSGYYAIPPVMFSHTLPGDTTRYFSSTSPVMLMVNTIAVDTTQAIKDIKEPLSAPLTLMEILPWVIGGLFLAAVITLAVIFIVRRRRKQPVFGRSKPKVPAHVRALESLEALRAKHLWQHGKVKEYHSALTDIIRIYIEERFGVAAMEMITSDVIAALKGHPDINEGNMDRLRQLLQMADLVKFAKFTPLPDEHDASMRGAIRFVSETAAAPEPESEELPAENESTGVEPEKPQEP